MYDTTLCLCRPGSHALFLVLILMLTCVVRENQPFWFNLKPGLKTQLYIVTQKLHLWTAYCNVRWPTRAIRKFLFQYKNIHSSTKVFILVQQFIFRYKTDIYCSLFRDSIHEHPFCFDHVSRMCKGVWERTQHISNICTGKYFCTGKYNQCTAINIFVPENKLLCQNKYCCIALVGHRNAAIPGLTMSL